MKAVAMRRVRFALVGFSVVLNLIFIGATAGFLLRPRHRGVEAVVAYMSSDLSRRDADILRSTLLQDPARRRDAIQAAREAHLRVDEALRAQPFDAAALHRALDDWREKFSAFLSIFEEPFVQAAQQMSPEGRAKLAARSDREARGHHE